ncbi:MULTISPECIES: toprim domain-containing protein [unclassified Novosphingobium]|uniref:DUF7146 domain-containing protein n=1 Tax=unclassified Novosphingobium TaxID=2644732 RepID=UPI00146B8DDE|nr:MULTISPECIES: toprim domain-containing protein [unclassified Novosphingobium]NMN06472.1 hypothetical protein [Novosphingobium sp. SG919]NMN89080.1 hypothetical protein [Novosphingobium sp. SG916]
MPHQSDSAWAALVTRLGGHWNGHGAMVRCPVHADRTPSLSLRAGDNGLLVHCFAGCDPRAVLRALRALGPLPVPAPDPSPAGASLGLVCRLWDQAGAVAGTLGERYLRGRRGLLALPPDLRFHPRCPMGKGHAARFEPALLVGVFRLGQLVAVQRRFLDPVTGARTERMMLGASRGGLWPSHSDGPELAVAEGLESACAYQQVTGQPAATCFGAASFASLPPLGSQLRYVLLPDNDAAGLSAASRALDRLAERGIAARIARCPAGFGDWGAMIEPEHGLPGRDIAT